MKRITLLLVVLAVLAASPAVAQPSLLKSPTGKVEVSFSLGADGAALYSVTYAGKPVVADSRLGLSLRQAGPLASGFRVLDVKRTSRDERYPLVAGKTPSLSSKSVCDECPLERLTEAPARLRRSYEIPEPRRCLLSQGFLCMGPATRAGCDAACTHRGMPCTGCRGPAETVWDQGVAMIDALAAMAVDLAGFQLPRMAGTFARYTYASSQLDKLRKKVSE